MVKMNKQDFINKIGELGINLTDEQFVAICKTGGVVGINFYINFLGIDCFDKIYKNIYNMH